MTLRIILLGCFLYSNVSLCQVSNTSLSKLISEADSIYFNHSDYSTVKEFKRGISVYNQALRTLNDSISKEILAKKYALQSLYFEYSNQLDSALAYSKKSILIQNQTNKQNLLLKGHIYRRLYKQYQKVNEIDSMIWAAEKARTIFTDTIGPNHTLISGAIFDIGFAFSRKGERDKNIEYYKKAIAMIIAHKGEFNPDAAIQEHHLALTYGFIGFYKKELESYKKVVKRWEAISDYKDMSYLSIAYGSLSTWYLEHGDVKTAEQYLLKQEALIKERKQDLRYWYNETFKGRTQTRIWYNKANLALYNKDTLNASLYNEKVLSFIANFDRNDSSNNPHNLSYSNNFVDLQHMKSLRLKAKILKNKEPEKAKELNEQVLGLAREDEVPKVTLGEKLNILDYYLDAKSFSTAREKLNEWIIVARNWKSDYVLMHLYEKKAKIALLKGDFDGMDKSYKTIFKKLQRDSLQTISIQSIKAEDCKPYGDGSILDIIMKASSNYSKAYRATSKEDYLKKTYNLSVLASSVFSENFSYSPFNESKYETAIKINEQLLSTALLFNDEVVMDKVLESIEQTGSKLSWKKFLGSRQRDNLNIPDSILERESELKSALHFNKKALFTDNESNEEKLKIYKNKIYDTEIEIERLEGWYRDNYPNYFNQTQNSFNLSVLKGKLKDNQYIIRYVVSHEYIYAFVITTSTTELFNLGEKEILYKKVNPFIKSLGKINSDDYRELAKQLYDDLIPKTIPRSTKKKELIFIQDDLLAFMPMEILLGADNKYLIQSHAISYAPSLLLWDEQLKVKKSRKNKLGIFAPSYKKVRNRSNNRDDDTELLGASVEATEIGKLFKADVFSGLTATKEQFLDNAKNYNILHLAMHSAINNTDAEFSNLNFSSEADGKLFISELYNMNLDADLAVLSACNTGAGNLEKGEGLINISRAFTYAGVPSMVTSLWKVPDQETSQIMVSFYKYLKDGETKNVALQMAKLDYLENTTDIELKHPYYWAGFIVSGNMEPIASNTSIWLYGLVALILLGLLFRKRLIQLFK